MRDRHVHQNMQDNVTLLSPASYGCKNKIVILTNIS